MTLETLWNYHRGEVNDDANENIVANYMRNNIKTTTSRSIKYKTKIIGSSPDDTNTLNTEAVLPLKYFINFWRYLNLLLIKCVMDLQQILDLCILDLLNVAE